MSAAANSGWELPGAGFKWDSQPGQDAALAAARSDKFVPSRFETFAAPQVRPGRTFARSALEASLDAAALPVVAASRAADYFTGNKSEFSDISGKDAAESLEWLYDRSDPAQIRREETFAEGEIPQALTAGKFLGEYAGGAPLAALTGRIPAAGAILNATSPRKNKIGLRKSAESHESFRDEIARVRATAAEKAAAGDQKAKDYLARMAENDAGEARQVEYQRAADVLPPDMIRAKDAMAERATLKAKPPKARSLAEKDRIDELDMVISAHKEAKRNFDARRKELRKEKR